VTKLEQELADLQKKIEHLKAILASRDMQMDIVKQEMREIKNKYPCPRKTTIVDDVANISVRRADVKNTIQDWTVALTAAGTVKFLNQVEFWDHAKKPISANTPLSHIYTQAEQCKKDSTVLIFTNLGNVIRVLLDEVECMDYRSGGIRLAQLCENAEKDEMPVKVLSYEGDIPEGDLLFFTKDGTVKRSHWSEYEMGNKLFMAATKLKPDDKVIAVEPYDPDEFSSMLFITKGGMALNANKDEVPVQGRIAGGVRGILLNDKDEVVSVFQHNGEGEIIIVTQAGTFKRVISSLLDQLPRARKGVLIADRSKGNVIFADYVTVPYKLAVQNGDKTFVELSSEDISIETRVSKGKPVKGITDIKGVYALKYKSEYEQ
jgi:topoisomerase-4 subunit A